MIISFCYSSFGLDGKECRMENGAVKFTAPFFA